jgi:hypothetical protein
MNMCVRRLMLLLVAAAFAAPFAGCTGGGGPEGKGEGSASTMTEPGAMDATTGGMAKPEDMKP